MTYQEQTLLYLNVEKALSTAQDSPYQKRVKKDIDKGFQICVIKKWVDHRELTIISVRCDFYSLPLGTPI